MQPGGIMRTRSRGGTWDILTTTRSAPFFLYKILIAYRAWLASGASGLVYDHGRLLHAHGSSRGFLYLQSNFGSRPIPLCPFVTSPPTFRPIPPHNNHQYSIPPPHPPTLCLVWWNPAVYYFSVTCANESRRGSRVIKNTLSVIFELRDCLR